MNDPFTAMFHATPAYKPLWKMGVGKGGDLIRENGRVVTFRAAERTEAQTIADERYGVGVTVVIRA